MKITFLGSGSAFFPPWEGNYQSNLIIEAPSGKKLLIDCGTQVEMALHDQGLSIFDIDGIFISHLHADHIGSLEAVAFKTYFNPNAPKPKLFGNAKMMEFLWSDSLKGGLASIQGKVVKLEDYFDVQGVARNGSFEWEGVEFRLIRTLHIMDGFDYVPSYGLMFKVNGQTIFFTADSQHCPHQIMDFYRISDVIFHDCETAPYKSGVHAHYTELVTLPDDVKAKMYLYHYQPGPLPDAVADGFRGFVVKGQTFDF